MCTIGDCLSDLGTALAYWWMQRIQRSCSKIAGDPQPIRQFYKEEFVQHYVRKRVRCFPDRFLSHFRAFQACGHRAADLFSLPQGLTKDERFASMPREFKSSCAPLCTARKLDKSSAHFSIQIRARHICNQFQMDDR